jgi:hypothetical protein
MASLECLDDLSLFCLGISTSACHVGSECLMVELPETLRLWSWTFREADCQAMGVHDGNPTYVPGSMCKTGGS